MNPVLDSAIREHDKKLTVNDEIALKMLAKTNNDMDTFYERMTDCIEELNQMNIEHRDKQRIMYDFFCGIHKTLLGYNLSAEGAITVAKELVTFFENIQSLYEHELLPKFDREGLMVTKNKNDEEMNDDDRERRTGTIHQ